MHGGLPRTKVTNLIRKCTGTYINPVFAIATMLHYKEKDKMCVLAKLKLKMLQAILGHRLTAYSLYNVAFHSLQCNLTFLQCICVCKSSITGHY